MTLSSLTATEFARHTRAIHKIRHQLFRKHPPADYFILPGSERCLTGYAEDCWNAASGSYRTVHLGGLSYATDCADAAGPCELSVSHVDGDLFSFWLKAAKGHTLSSLSVRFRDLDHVPHAYVQSYRRSNSAPVYGGQRG